MAGLSRRSQCADGRPQLIYLPAKPTDDLKSFSSKILSCHDTRTGSSWFGPWFWQATFRPVADGNIPTDITQVNAKFVFHDGGFNDFQSKFTLINSRLHDAAQLAQETGDARLLQTVHDEQLPEYTGPQRGSDGGQGDNPVSPDAQRADQANRQAQENPSVPDEPPPGYDEAQAQAITMRFDERARDEAERE